MVFHCLPERQRRLALVLSFLALLLLSPAFSGAQNFKPFAKLRVLETAHFSIIYPPESEASAYLLAAGADAQYERISSLLGITLSAKVPVSITPHTAEINGYMNPVPYPHIFLFDTFEDSDNAAFQGSLESLFFHELTHAVAGSARSPLFQVLHALFGGWAYPAGLNAPWGIIEGTAVLFESLDGSGRANDPLVKQRLRQDILDGRWKAPAAALSGAWDLPPGGSVHYEYGGLFCRWLSDTYGLEMFADLAREIGSLPRPSLFYLRSGFYACFRKVYGLPFADAWYAFEQSLALDGVRPVGTHDDPNAAADGTPRVVYSGEGGKARIADVASGGGAVFFLDTLSGSLMRYDPAAGRSRALCAVSAASYALDAADDGERVLVSTFSRRGAITGQRSVAVVYEYAVKGERASPTGRAWENLYYGAFPGGEGESGVIGLEADTHRQNLVYRPGDDRSGKESRTLLSAGEALSFTRPAALDSERIILTVTQSGARALGVFDRKRGELSVLRTGLPDDSERWKYVRGLGESEGRVFFAYNHDDRMYKLGVATLGGDAGEAQVLFSDIDFSGGVMFPVALSGEVYYKAAFSPWDALCAQDIAALSGVTAPLTLVPAASPLPSPAGANEPPPAPRPSHPYHGLKYYNPFKLWLPYPHVTLTESGAALDGAGVLSYLSDPLDQNLLLLTAAWAGTYRHAPFSVTWLNYSLGFQTQITASDSVDGARAGAALRTAGVSVSPSFRIPLAQDTQSLSLSPGWGFSLFAYDSGEPLSYAWPASFYHYVYAGAAYSTVRRKAYEQYGTGVTLKLYGSSIFLEDRQSERAEARLAVFVERPLPPLPFLGFRAEAYAACDKAGMNIYGASAYWKPALFGDLAAVEFPAEGTGGLTWLTGAEAELRLFAIEHQANISHIYLNRTWGALGGRFLTGGAFTPPSPLTSPASSLFARLVFETSFTPVTVLVVNLRAELYAACRLITPTAAPLPPLTGGFKYSISY